MNEYTKRILRNHCRKFKESNKRLKALIRLADFDLQVGTVHGQEEYDEDGLIIEYKDFQHACNEIKTLAEPFLQDIWIDLQSEEILTTEPQAYPVDEENPEYNPDDPQSEKIIRRMEEPCWDDIVFVESRHLKYTLFGKELTPHI